MVRTWASTITFCACLVLHAQEPVPYTGPGLLRASGTISPGFLLKQGTTNIYFGGKLEYFTDDKLSFRGEGLWYAGSQQKPAPLLQNSQLSFGPFLHSVHGRLDLSAGVEAGISLVHPADVWIRTMEAPDQPYADPAPPRAVPQASLCASLNYAVWDYLHFFVDVRLVHAVYNGSPEGALPLDEVILGAGLGWQLATKN